MKQDYNSYIKSVTPTKSLFKNMLMAFLVGGLICTIGQAIINLLMNLGLTKDDAAAYETLILVGIAILLTALNIYSKIAKIAGAGTLVPITGFANSVGACAIEFKKEGQVFGIGCKIFTIAGPVILYGLLSSGFLGFIYWVLNL